MVTVLDSFEDGDISEYSGDTASFAVTTTDPYDGSQALEPDLTTAAIYRSDVTISQGETPFGAWVHAGEASGSKGLSASWNVGLLWATPGSEWSGYAINVDGSLNDVELRRYDTGSATTLSTDSGVSKGNYYEVAVETWDSNGNISLTVYDTSGTEIAMLSATDTTYTDEGIGWYSNVSASNVNVQPFLDYYYKTVPLQPPPNFQITDTSTEDELTLDWDSVSGANGYYVYRAQSTGSSVNDYTQVADVSGPPYTDTGLEDGEQYYYRVSSHD
jgi:hypothetical protein